jgi:hypothetical protein
VIPTAVETGQFGYDHDSDDSPVRTETNVLHEGFEEPSLVNGNKENGQARREQTPESNDGDEEEFMAIKMVDYDDDDEDDEDYDKE